MGATVLLFAMVLAGKASAQTIVCTNSSSFVLPEDARLVRDHADVETAGYTIVSPSGTIDVNENSISREWKRPRHKRLSDGRIVLESADNGAISYGFPRKDDANRPMLIISGSGLAGNKSDLSLLSQFRTTDWGQAEHDKRCTIVLHYGWSNVLGPPAK